MRIITFLCVMLALSCGASGTSTSSRPNPISPLGSACMDSAECASGFCVDGVCCDTACGGGATTDCQACSKAKGAATDGTCGVASSATVCRPAKHPACDVAEKCNGVALTCPADVLLSGGLNGLPDGRCSSIPFSSDDYPCWYAGLCISGNCINEMPRPGMPGVCRFTQQGSGDNYDCHANRTCDGMGTCSAENFPPVGTGCKMYVSNLRLCGKCDAAHTCRGPFTDIGVTAEPCP